MIAANIFRPAAEAVAAAKPDRFAARPGSPGARRPESAKTRAGWIARVGIRALHEELSLFPKPGLVSPRDSGSHDDMDAVSMGRAIFALRHGLVEIARAGARGDAFARLVAIGRTMETRMWRVTNGVNTHRGAIFHFGLLAATAAAGDARSDASGAEGLLSAVQARWGDAVRAAAVPEASDPSHGQRARRLYGAGGAREEAASGYPTVRTTALPAFRDALARLGATPGCRRRALVQTLFALIATVEDTNLLHRAGPAGLAFARRAAREFLDAGGVFSPDWETRAVAVHRDFCARRLSPGGSADLLAVTIFACELASGGGAPAAPACRPD